MQTQTVTSSPPVVSRFSPNLEAIRGFAALLVVWGHAVSFPRTLDPGYSATGFFAYLAPSHFSVLVFFVLSGYVIGLTNRRALTGATIKQYLRKRATRLYPIYFVCMLLALLVAGGAAYSWRTILGNFTFLQILLTPVISENAPSWSLHFEVIYYLLFIPISYLGLHPLLMTGLSSAVGLLNLWLFPTNPLLSSYGFGFSFWLAGLTLAYYTDTFSYRQPSYQQLLAVLLLFVSFRGLDAPETLLRKIADAVAGSHLHYTGGDNFTGIISFYDYAWLPYAVAGIVLFAHKSFRYQKAVTTGLFLLPGFTWLHVYETRDALNVSLYGLSGVFYTLALLTHFLASSRVEQLGKLLIGVFIRVGSLSYGLYIVHFPLLMLMARLNFFMGSALTFWVRFVVLLVASLLAAYWLERKFQPWIKARWA